MRDAIDLARACVSISRAIISGLNSGDRLCATEYNIAGKADRQNHSINQSLSLFNRLSSVYLAVEAEC